MQDGVALAGPAPHPQRVILNNEVHARPSDPIATPMRVSHLALLPVEGSGEVEVQHLRKLARMHGAAQPAADAVFFVLDVGTYRLKWERHTEFSTYTFYRAGAARGFAETALDSVPRDWLRGLGGQLLVGIHVTIDEAKAPPAVADIAAAFGSNDFIGVTLRKERAFFFTDLRLQGDGFSRMILMVDGMPPDPLGRTLQALLEIETYRMMALLALPIARQASVEVGALEDQLAEVTGALAAATNVTEERGLLARLTAMASDAEKLASRTSFRLAASRAYYEIVQARIGQLQEARLFDQPTVAEFMERRLAPAMKTCQSVGVRLQALIERAARATELLRTRVDVAVEEQNAALLRSMNENARAQLRLQQTVEGLSAVAISYYLVGLVGYAAKGLEKIGLPVSPELVMALAVPFVAFGAWWGLRRVREGITGGRQ